jgi:threonine dehydratase
VNRFDVAEAAERIRPHVRRTPLLELELPEGTVTAKLEHHQHGGSFKFRGAMNRLLTADPEAAVVAASGGNHGIAVALAGARLGRRVTVFVPSTAPAAKKRAIQAAGAELREAGGSYAEAEAAALLHTRDGRATFVHAYDDPLVAAGQGTCLAEARAQQPGIEHWVVAVGGGGLLAGCLAAADGEVRVTAVEPEGAPTLARAVEAGMPVRVDVNTVCASALGAAVVSARTLDMVQRTATPVVLVRDEVILQTQHRLWREHRVLVEPSGAAALAALETGRIEQGPGTAVLLCGANTDEVPASP